MHGVVREHEVYDSFKVNAAPKVFVVSPREASADTVVKVHHACHAVEPETVEFELFHIEPQIAEEEAKDLVVSVVEQSAVPKLVVPSRSTVEVEVISSVEHIKAVKDVLASVRVNDIEQDNYTHAVGCVDEFFQFFGGAVARTCGKETGDLVSKGWKVLNRHSVEIAVMGNYRHSTRAPLSP